MNVSLEAIFSLPISTESVFLLLWIVISLVTIHKGSSFWRTVLFSGDNEWWGAACLISHGWRVHPKESSPNWNPLCLRNVITPLNCSWMSCKGYRSPICLRLGFILAGTTDYRVIALAEMPDSRISLMPRSPPSWTDPKPPLRYIQPR